MEHEERLSFFDLEIAKLIVSRVSDETKIIIEIEQEEENE